MKKIMLLFLIPIMIGVWNVSASGTLNVAPVAVDDTAVTNEDVAVLVNVVSNDTDANGNTLNVTAVSNINNWVSAVINVQWTGVLFTPTPFFNGTWSFEYTVSDGTLTDTGKVLLTVNAVNNKPVAVNDSFTVSKNSTTTLNLVVNDTDVDSNNLHVVSIGTILNASGTLTNSWVVLKPNTNFVGLINFEYTVSDGALTDTGMVSINVTATQENISPVAVNDSLTTSEDKSKTINPIVNDTDANGDMLMVTSVTQPTYGSVTFTHVSVTYNPDDDFTGSDSFKYTISDGKGWTATGQVNVVVKDDRNSNDDDDDEDEDEDDDDNNGNHGKNKHEVRDLQKEFIEKFKDLKKEYKKQKNNDLKEEFLLKQKQLRAEYLLKLQSITGTTKKFSVESDSSKANYKAIYTARYGVKISLMTDAQLQVVIGKIDNAITQVNSSTTYSPLTKRNLNTRLLALRELVEENMNDSSDIIDIDALFQ